MNYKTIIFDYDGTLHQTDIIYEKAFLNAYQYLVQNGYQKERNWKKEEIGAFIGQSPVEMWQSFTPKLSPEIIQKVSKMISDEMLNLIESHQAKLYPETLHTLAYLKDKGYDLYYLSNSKHYYMEAHRKEFELDRYFKGFYCSEDYQFIPKKDILLEIKKNFKTPMVMVGDRIHDMDTALHNQIDSIGCRYGYGSLEELKDATYTINSIQELKTIL